MVSSAPAVLEVRGPIATLTVNRPARKNSLDLFSAVMIEQLVRSVSEREELRVLTITGQEDAFCAGVDPEYIGQIQTMGDVESYRQFLRVGRNLLLMFRRMPQLVIASVNGIATGAGLGLVLASDWSVAAEEASFGETSASDGLFPGWTGYWLLQERLGTSRAMEMVMLGQMLAAEEALDHGIVNWVVARENLRECTERIAASLAEAPPLVLREIKRSIYENHYRKCEEKSDFEVEGQMRCFLSEDSRAGVQAVLRKRKAKFEGR